MKKNSWFSEVNDFARRRWRGKGKRRRYSIDFDQLTELGVTDAHIHGDKPYLLKRISHLGTEFNSLGEIDGIEGQGQQAFEAIARNKARQWQAFLEAAFNGEMGGALQRVESLKDRKENAQRIAEKRQGTLEVLMDRYNWKPQRFNWIMGFVYLIITALLILADIPLAFRLMESGFEMPVDTGVSAVVTVSQLPEVWSDYAVEGLFLAIGITLFTVYIKIFYDEFLAEPLEKSAMRFSEKGLGRTLTDEQTMAAKRIWRGRMFMKLVVLILLIVTLVFLGVLRDYSLDDASISIDQTINPNFQIDLDIDSLMGNESNHVRDFRDHMRLASFILITLLFPIISGICASLGLERLQNAWVLQRARMGLVLARWRKLQLTTKVIEASNEVETFRSYLKWCQKDSQFEEDYTDYFYACYLHGYQRGWTKDIPNDLFLKAEFLRSRYLNMQAVTHLTGSNRRL